MNNDWNWMSITKNNNHFLVVGHTISNIYTKNALYSTDGDTWKIAGLTPNFSLELNSIAYGEGYWVTTVNNCKSCPFNIKLLRIFDNIISHSSQHYWEIIYDPIDELPDIVFISYKSKKFKYFWGLN